MYDLNIDYFILKSTKKKYISSLTSHGLKIRGFYARLYKIEVDTFDNFMGIMGMSIASMAAIKIIFYSIMGVII